MNIIEMDLTSIMIGALSMLGLAVPAYLKFRIDLLNYKKEVNKKRIENVNLKKTNRDDKVKLEFLNRIMEFDSINKIKNAVGELFEKTKADRFLILIAVNGKIDFNIVNVVYEQKQSPEDKINQIMVYRNVEIDNHYRKMLKESEKELVELRVDEMEDCLLKTLYEIEKVTFSSIRFICRRPIDKDNDFLVYSSLATHDEKGFTSHEKALAQLTYESIIKPSINKLLK